MQQKAPDAPVDDVAATAPAEPTAVAPPVEAAKPAVTASPVAKKKFNRADF